MNASEQVSDLLSRVVERHRRRGVISAIGEATSISALVPTTAATLQRLLPGALEQRVAGEGPRLLVQVNSFRPVSSELMQALWATVGATESARVWRRAGTRAAAPDEVQPTGLFPRVIERVMSDATSLAAAGGAALGALLGWSVSGYLLARSEPYLELVLAVPDTGRVGSTRQYTYVIGMFVDSVYAHDGDWLLGFGYQKHLASMHLAGAMNAGWRFTMTDVRDRDRWRATSLTLETTGPLPDQTATSHVTGTSTRILDIARQPMLARHVGPSDAEYAVSRYDVLQTPVAACALGASLRCDDTSWWSEFGLDACTMRAAAALSFERYRVGLFLPEFVQLKDL